MVLVLRILSLSGGGCLLAVSQSALFHIASSVFLPAGPVPARIDVNERSVPRGRSIQASATHEIGICPLHPLLGLQNHPRVVDVDLAVMVEVVHGPVAVIVDEDVAGVAVHVPAEVGA